MTGNTPNSRALQAGNLWIFWQAFRRTLFVQAGTLLLALSLSHASMTIAATDHPVLLAALSSFEQNASETTTEPATPVQPTTDDQSDLATMEDLAEPAPVKPAPRVKPSRIRLPLQEAFYHVTSQRLVGMASWYGPGFHGRRAADGSRFDQHAMTAAHKSLPFGTVVRVTNTRTGKSCLVRITDRGPYIHGRIIDLSMAAADAIGMRGSGVANVTVEVLAPRDTQTAERPHDIASEV